MVTAVEAGVQAVGAGCEEALERTVVAEGGADAEDLAGQRWSCGVAKWLAWLRWQVPLCRTQRVCSSQFEPARKPSHPSPSFHVSQQQQPLQWLHCPGVYPQLSQQLRPRRWRSPHLVVLGTNPLFALPLSSSQVVVVL